MWTVRIFAEGANINEPPAHEESRENFRDARSLLREVASPDVVILLIETDSYSEYMLVNGDNRTGRATIDYSAE